MKILYAHEVEPMLFHSEDVMFFDTLSDAILHAGQDDQIIHYGKKGMRWGVVNTGANIGLKTNKFLGRHKVANLLVNGPIHGRSSRTNARIKALETAKINNSRNKNDLVTSKITSKDVSGVKAKVYAKIAEKQRKAAGPGVRAFNMRVQNANLGAAYSGKAALTKRQVANRSVYNEEMAKYFSDQYRNKQKRKGRM